MYLTNLASRVRDCVPPEVAVPANSEDLFILYALLARAKGAATTLSDVHDAWAVWQASIDATHKSLVPFDQLPGEVKAEDEPFLIAIKLAVEGAAKSAE